MTIDTKAVKRWEIGFIGLNNAPEMLWHYKGSYILFTDHERVVEDFMAERAKNTELFRAADANIANLRTALAASRAEVEGLRKDAERRLDLIRATVENSEWRHGSRNIYGELKREIQAADAAMENNNV